MAMTLDELLDEIVRKEGGYVNHPNDPGGPTNLGITQQTLSEWLQRPATIDEVRNLDIETAKEIYRQRYVSGPGMDQLPESIMPSVVDMGVNAGPRVAVRLLQQVINRAGFGPIGADGVIGPKTMAAAQAAETAMGGMLVNAYADERISFYRGLAAGNPRFQVFLQGWTNRANSWRVPLNG